MKRGQFDFILGVVQLCAKGLDTVDEVFLTQDKTNATFRFLGAVHAEYNCGYDSGGNRNEKDRFSVDYSRIEVLQLKEDAEFVFVAPCIAFRQTHLIKGARSQFTVGEYNRRYGGRQSRVIDGMEDNGFHLLQGSEVPLQADCMESNGNAFVAVGVVSPKQGIVVCYGGAKSSYVLGSDRPNDLGKCLKKLKLRWRRVWDVGMWILRRDCRSGGIDFKRIIKFGWGRDFDLQFCQNFQRVFAGAVVVKDWGACLYSYGAGSLIWTCRYHRKEVMPSLWRGLLWRPRLAPIVPPGGTCLYIYEKNCPAQMQQAAQHVMNARAGVDDSGSPLRPSY